MPKLEKFKTEDDYWATMWHEATHATGHEDRLDRTFGKRFGDNAYAWLKALKNDKRAIFTAAKKATQAAEWVIKSGEGAAEMAA